MRKTEQQIRKFLEDRSWDQLRPGDLAKSVAIEAGELLEVFQWDNPELEVVKRDPKRIAEIEKELADVLLYCYDIAILLDLDVEDVIKKKLAYIEKKYPAELFKDAAEEQGTQDTYWTIKRKHRQET